MSTYNSLRPKYQSSFAQPEALVRCSLDSKPKEMTEKKFKQMVKMERMQKTQNETLGYRDSVFDENFDDCPLSQKYG